MSSNGCQLSELFAATTWASSSGAIPCAALTRCSSSSLLHMPAQRTSICASWLARLSELQRTRRSAVARRWESSFRVAFRRVCDTNRSLSSHCSRGSTQSSINTLLMRFAREHARTVWLAGCLALTRACLMTAALHNYLVSCAEYILRYSR